MADFCGLTRVKTWRWSRLFACAVAVFCAIFPISSFAAGTLDAYSCPAITLTCNPGFYNNNGVCTKCSAGKYNAKSGATYCLDCPANTVENGCPEYEVGNYNYGRPGIMCKAGYYRKYDEYNGTILGLKCEQCPNGSYKNADADIGLTSFDAGDPVPVNSGLVQIQNISDGAEQCGTCAEGYYQKGFYRSTANYNASTRCAPCSSASSGGSSLQACKTNGEILCGAGYYRDAKTDGTVKCEPCNPSSDPTYTTKAADKSVENGGDKSYGKTMCNVCISGNYYYSRNGSTICFACPDNSYKNSSGACNSTAMYRDGRNDIKCKQGYYRTNDGQNGHVLCSACPTGYTTAYYDEHGPEKDQYEGTVCIRCAEGYFRLPYGLFSDVPTRLRGNEGCYKCPSDNVKNCGTNPYYDNTDDGYYDERYYLVCNDGYYSVLENENTSNERYVCKKCDGGATSSSEYYYPYQLFYDYDGFWAINNDGEFAYPSIELDVAQADWVQDLHEENPFPSGNASCNSCKNGYFAPYGQSASETSCYKCPENNAGCSSGGVVRCPANTYLNDKGLNSVFDYDGRFSCEACPAFTGKMTDGAHHYSNLGGVKECNICVDGYFGSPVNNENNFNRANCKHCPAFAKLNELGICIHGNTDKPTDQSDAFGVNTVNQCYIRNATQTISYNGYENITVIPKFTDTTGTFEFLARDDMCPLQNASATVSGSCKLEAGLFCVYVDMDIGNNNDKLDNPDACVAAIMWRAMVDDKYTISPDTAEDIMHHWGNANPWYCATPNPVNDTAEALANAKTVAKQEAQAFVACLTGGNPDCKYNNLSCMPVNSANVKVCETDGNGGCTDVTN